jgi:DNA-binding NtrC family response regulator
MVLIIDDDQSVRILTERLVKSFGFTPLTAATGAEGIALLEANSSEVGAVVLDLTMPELNGEQTFLKLRGLDPELPIIFTSGYEKGEDVPRDSRTDFLQKPFKRDELRDKLEKFLLRKSGAA